MTHKQFQLHTIFDIDNMPFEPSDYSKFKYGSKSKARLFGREMGRKLAPILPTDKQLIIYPAPYSFIPTATFALKDYLLAELNKRMVDRGMKNPIQEGKIYREAGYCTDYGKMSIEERKAAIGSEQFHMDTSFVKGKVALFLDDIRVTGAHEERMREMLTRLCPECECIFLYFAKVDGYYDPKIEDHLNLFSMKSLLDLDFIIKNDVFIFNTRNVKFILNADHSEFKNFIRFQSKIFRETLYSNLLGNGYHKEEKFIHNVNYLKTIL